MNCCGAFGGLHGSKSIFGLTNYGEKKERYMPYYWYNRFLMIVSWMTRAE